jgi:sugar lactone lactonase YvrE
MRQRSGSWFVVLSLAILWLTQVRPAVGQEGFSEPPIFLRNLNDTRDGIGPCWLGVPGYDENCVDPDGDGPLVVGDGHQWTWNHRGIAFDSQGNYYIVDGGHRQVRKFDRRDRMVSKWTITGLYWNDAWDVDVDSQDNVWVSTRRDGVIKKYDSDGNPLDGSIFVGARINGIHIDGADRIFVALDGPWQGEVRRYDSGFFAKQIFPINNPFDIATDSAGNIWVIASDYFIEPGYYLKKYDRNGLRLASFATDGVPHGILIDDNDRVYLSHVHRDSRVIVHDSDMNELYWFGSEGTGDGEFRTPMYLGFTPSGDTLYVSDRQNARYVVFVADAETAVEDLIEQIEDLIDEGTLGGGQGNALIAKLQAALQKLLDDKTKTAINQLSAFRNQVEAFIQSGELTPEEVQPLLDAVDAIIAVLGG